MEVVVFGSKTGNPHEIFTKEYFGREYPSAAIQCDEKATLASVIEEALNHLGLVREGEISYLVFGDAKTQDGCPIVYYWILDVVDDQGVIRWRVAEDNWNTISLQNLIESQEAGLIVGYPRTIHVVLSHPIGNGFFIEWPVFLKQLALIGDWAGRFVAIGAVVKAGAQVVKKCHHKWQARGAQPDDIYHYITSKQSWDSRDLAKRLPVTEDEAKNLLKLFGFRYDRSSRLYVVSRDKQAKMIYNKFKNIFEEK